MQALCVYCGSNHGKDPQYGERAAELGAALAEREWSLVYGGARNGLMGQVADAVLAAGGRVTGVIPYALVAWEQAHDGLTEQIVVSSMRERKQEMAERADAFVALPGGIGTLEEIFEMISWAQLGVHSKPCAFLNVNGYYDKLIAFLDHSVEQGLMRDRVRQMILIADDVPTLLQQLASYVAPSAPSWPTSAET